MLNLDKFHKMRRRLLKFMGHHSPNEAATSLPVTMAHSIPYVGADLNDAELDRLTNHIKNQNPRSITLMQVRFDEVSDECFQRFTSAITHSNVQVLHLTGELDGSLSSGFFTEAQVDALQEMLAAPLQLTVIDLSNKLSQPAVSRLTQTIKHNVSTSLNAALFSAKTTENTQQLNCLNEQLRFQRQLRQLQTFDPQTFFDNAVKEYLGVNHSPLKRIGKKNAQVWFKSIMQELEGIDDKYQQVIRFIELFHDRISTRANAHLGSGFFGSNSGRLKTGKLRSKSFENVLLKALLDMFRIRFDYNKFYSSEYGPERVAKLAELAQSVQSFQALRGEMQQSLPATEMDQGLVEADAYEIVTAYATPVAQ